MASNGLVFPPCPSSPACLQVEWADNMSTAPDGIAGPTAGWGSALGDSHSSSSSNSRATGKAGKGFGSSTTSSRGKGAKKESKAKKRAQQEEGRKAGRAPGAPDAAEVPKGGSTPGILEQELRWLGDFLSAKIMRFTLPMLSQATGFNLELDTPISPFHEEAAMSGWVLAY